MILIVVNGGVDGPRCYGLRDIIDNRIGIVVGYCCSH